MPYRERADGWSCDSNATRATRCLDLAPDCTESSWVSIGRSSNSAHQSAGMQRIDVATHSGRQRINHRAARDAALRASLGWPTTPYATPTGAVRPDSQPAASMRSTNAPEPNRRSSSTVTMQAAPACHAEPIPASVAACCPRLTSFRTMVTPGACASPRSVWVGTIDPSSTTITCAEWIDTRSSAATPSAAATAERTASQIHRSLSNVGITTAKSCRSAAPMAPRYRADRVVSPGSDR